MTYATKMALVGHAFQSLNASMTELLAMAPSSDGSLPQGVQLSGGVAHYVPSFKYLGGLEMRQPLVMLKFVLA
jgi:hypothetical protein